MVWILGGENCIGPEDITPGIELRVASSRNIAHLKDTGGSISYDVWVDSGLINGYNATLEFLKAILKPGRDGVSIEACFERAKPTEYIYEENKIVGVKQIGEAEAIWNWYIEKKMKRTLAVTKSTSSSEASPEPASPSA